MCSIQFGVMIGSRLLDDRTFVKRAAWQPLANPKDPGSEPITVPFDRITGMYPGLAVTMLSFERIVKGVRTLSRTTLFSV